VEGVRDQGEEWWRGRRGGAGAEAETGTVGRQELSWILQSHTAAACWAAAARQAKATAALCFGVAEGQTWCWCRGWLWLVSCLRWDEAGSCDAATVELQAV